MTKCLAVGRPAPVRRVFWWALAAVVILVCSGIGANQLLGRDMGEPCVDSYSCKGFLLGGAECVQLDSQSHCTRYCGSDADCPETWSCLGATPTVLRLETSAVDEVCVPNTESP